MTASLLLIYLIFSLIVLYHGMKSIIWEIGSAIYLIIATFIVGMPLGLAMVLWLLIIAIVLIIRLEPLRFMIAKHLQKRAQKSLPKLSKTEEEALNAGDVWLEEDIFKGNLDWKKMHAAFSTELSKEEQSFLDNETETLCSMLDEWSIAQELDLPEKVWDFMKAKGFFGLVIPKKYEGHGFSARAHSEVVMKIASRSGVAAVTCMVPNSLGPGELLNFYGTEEQKKHYLPRLAKGKEIPCFALTEPTAGSDATSLQSEAIVTTRSIDGKKVLGLVINNLNKRWITLAPIATLIGLAVNLKDPDGLLKGAGQEGLTCLLIPRDSKNLEIGNRHLAIFQPFMNGSIRGENIFVPIDSIIGGQKNAGKGWQMLVECLSIGRSLSLPALSAGISSSAYLASSAFGRIRRQFNVEIADFEGIEEKLAEIGGLTYLISATRLLTVAAVNAHKKPSVASAITKYYTTEFARIIINNAMDIHAGRAVVVGPRNYLTGSYLGLPISITVEGANIMSRNLLIFGQGSMACHPFIRKEFYALNKGDSQAFQELIWKHIAYFLQNFAKTFLSALTFGVFIHTPKSSLRRQYQKLLRLSQAFAFLADWSLIYLGGSLKRKERLSARLADAMSYLYMAMATLAQYEKNPKDAAEKVHALWALNYCFHQAEKAMRGLCMNFPSSIIGFLMRLFAFPFGQTFAYPSDKLGHRLAKAMRENTAFRDVLKSRVFIGKDKSGPLARMENALQLIIENNDLYEKIKDLRRCSLKEFQQKLADKVKGGSLTKAESTRLLEVERARWDAITVDEFSQESMKKKSFASIADNYLNPFSTTRHPEHSEGSPAHHTVQD